MKTSEYKYRVAWSAEDREHVGLCDQFPSLSWLAATSGDALSGIRRLVAAVVSDFERTGEPTPVLSTRMQRSF
jgi:hypothetical protein